MRNLLIFASLALMFIACNKSEERNSKFKLDTKTESVVISKLSVNDTLLKLNLKSTKVMSYISLNLVETANLSDDSQLVPEQLLRGKFENSVQYLLINNKFRQVDTTINFKSLKPNTKYSILAVSSNKDGVTSAISRLDFQTTDTEAPVLVAQPQYTDGKLVFTFSEAIKLNPEPQKLILTKLYFFYTKMNKPAEVHRITEKDMTVDGNKLVLTYPRAVVPGAYAIFDIPEALVSDMVGNNFAGITSSLKRVSKNVVTDGLAIRYPNALWSFVQPDLSLSALVAASGTLKLTTSDDISLFKATWSEKHPEHIATISYYYEDGSSESFANKLFLTDVQKGGNVATIQFNPSKLQAASKVVLSLPEGLIFDVNANANAAAEYTFQN